MKTDACEWLREFLRDGPREVSDIRMAAKQAGYKRAELQEAKRICRVVVKNNWSESHRVADKWFWALPEEG